MRTPHTLPAPHGGLLARPRRARRGAWLLGALTAALLLPGCESQTYGGKAPRAPKPALASPTQTPAPTPAEATKAPSQP